MLSRIVKVFLLLCLRANYHPNKTQIINLDFKEPSLDQIHVQSINHWICLENFLLPRKYQVLGHLLVEGLLLLFNDDMFLWFFMLIVFLCYFSHIWNSIYFFKPFLVTTQSETFNHTWSSGQIWGFPPTMSVWIYLLHSSCSLLCLNS